MYHRGILDPTAMTDLPADLRQRLVDSHSLALPDIVSLQDSHDEGTAKFVLRLADDRTIETVRIGMGAHTTLCLSSQAGCGYGCAFCATGRLGLLRNLTAAEIVAQVLVIRKVSGWHHVNGVNVVFMGMGEPLANYANLLTAIRTLHADDGLGIGARRITVSTVGVVPMIRKLATEGLPLGLALSLHATTDTLRDRLVPINQKWPLREVVAAVREYGAAVSRRPTLEYVLLAGVNDSPAEGRRLGQIARSIPAKVNIMLYNETAGPEFTRPSATAVHRFQEAVAQHAPAVTVRRSRGRDILAACGQLGGRPVSRGD
jgi:23S rRNA (adenine2503-C2)-methyltransferase